MPSKAHGVHRQRFPHIFVLSDKLLVHALLRVFGKSCFNPLAVIWKPSCATPKVAQSLAVSFAGVAMSSGTNAKTRSSSMSSRFPAFTLV